MAEELGFGGYSTIYLGYYEDEVYCIKSYYLSKGADKLNVAGEVEDLRYNNMKQIENEIVVLRSVRHPNIVALKGYYISANNQNFNIFL